MAFYIKRKESTRRALRRITSERVTKALWHLQHHDTLVAIHSVRKEIKKLRAILWLVRAGAKAKLQG